MAIYVIAIAIAATFALPSCARLVVHPKAVPNSYENQKTYKESEIHTQSFIDQTLQKNASVFVKRGFSGQASTISFRGLSAAHSLVLLDGVPLNGSSMGTYDFSGLQSQSIDSIKIIPGASSVLYGAGAVGGVVDMTSHQATRNQNKVQLEGGSFKTTSGYAGIDRVYDSGNYTVYAEGYRTDGLPKYEKSRKLGERNKNSNGSGGLYVNHAFRKTNLSFFMRGNASHLKYDTTMINLPPKPQGTQYRSTSLVGSKLTSDSKNYQCHHELLLARYNDYANYQGPSFTDHTKHYGSYKFSYYGIKDGETSVLISADEQILKQESGFKKDTTNFGTAVTHNHMIFHNFFLDLGIRNDHHKEYKNHQTYSSGLRYQYDKSTFFVSYRTGFLAPTLNELYKDNSYVESNRNLVPEKSHTIETGIKSEPIKGYKIHISYHRTILGKMLLSTQQTSGKWKTENVGSDTRIDGIDLQQTLSFDDNLNFSLGYSLINFDRHEPGIESYVPQHKVNASINWKISETVDSTLSAQWAGRRRNGSGPLDNYTTVDINLIHYIGNASQVYLRINNLFDERYTITPGYGTPRQEVYVGTILTF